MKGAIKCEINIFLHRTKFMFIRTIDLSIDWLIYCKETEFHNATVRLIGWLIDWVPLSAFFRHGLRAIFCVFLAAMCFIPSSCVISVDIFIQVRLMNRTSRHWQSMDLQQSQTRSVPDEWRWRCCRGHKKCVRRDGWYCCLLMVDIDGIRDRLLRTLAGKWRWLVLWLRTKIRALCWRAVVMTHLHVL